nr:MAG TPA: hypothetical protein [Caudoviricetes sp.]
MCLRVTPSARSWPAWTLWTGILLNIGVQHYWKRLAFIT